MLDHELGHVLDGHEGTERARSRAHSRLDRGLAGSVELIRAQKPEYHAILVDSHARIPACRADALPDVTDPLVETAGRHVPTCNVARARALCIGPFSGKSGREPILLARYVVVDLGES